jgi:hypothetical protein
MEDALYSHVLHPNHLEPYIHAYMKRSCLFSYAKPLLSVEYDICRVLVECWQHELGTIFGKEPVNFATAPEGR